MAGSNSRARRIQRVRKRLGESQVEFAERLGVHRMTISVWERGEKVPRLDSWEKILRIEGRLKAKRKAA